MAKHFYSKRFLMFICALAVLTFGTDVLKVQAFECGIKNFTRGLIAKGSKTDRGEWPFLIALRLVKNVSENNSFFCGGSLITEKHVLTAAHCLDRKSSSITITPADVIVVVGAYDLTLKNDSGVLQRNVSDIFIHPDWKSENDNYDADVAVLLLTESVPFTDNIKPVCVPSDDTVVDGRTGSVVGWGYTETNGEPNLQFIKHAFATVLGDAECYTGVPGLASISSPRMFCAQGKDGSPNLGDSGGGFYVDSGLAWVQQGIVSAVHSTGTGHVNENTTVIYTNVKKFKSWIVETVSQTGGVVGEAREEIKIDLRCNYGYNYRCELYDLNLRRDNAVVSSFGSHRNHKTNEDVETIAFENGTMFSLPAGIGKIFNNLQLLQIGENLSTKVITRYGLRNLENLTEIWIFKNDISTMDVDCLWDLPNLKSVSLTENKLKTIPGRTFHYNLKLSQVHLPGNQLEVLPVNLFRKNLLLEYVNVILNSIKIIHEGTFEKNALLRDVKLSDNKLQVLPKNLFEKNQLLKYVDLRNNSIKIIRIDFTSLKSIKRVDCHDNDCIDANYEGLDFPNYRNQYRNLTEFQDLIRSNCNPIITPRYL